MITTKPQVDVVVGGHYGSCAKGKVCGYLAGEYQAAVRGGSENAGHTLEFDDGETYKFQTLPVAAAANPNCLLYIGAGAVFSIEQLQKELGWMQKFNVSHRLQIDPNAVIIEEKHRNAERNAQMDKGIGSTVHGCGAALIDKLWRVNGVKLARDVSELVPFVERTHRVSSAIFDHVARGDRVMLEGTQGTLLSIDHTPHYPFATSRNVTASAIAAECGVAPALIREVILVFRTFPIRVGGNSGPTGSEELTWDEVSRRAGRQVEEFTTVTQRRRRIFEFDWNEALYSVMLNQPTQIALTFADYLDIKNHGATKYESLSAGTREFVNRMERTFGVPVTLISTGSRNGDTIDRRRRRFW